MPQDFSEALVKALKCDFYNGMLGPLPKSVGEEYLRKIEDVVERLEKLPFLVPEQVIKALESAIKTARNTDSRW